jgi:hypothetical protein
MKLLDSYKNKFSIATARFLPIHGQKQPGVILQPELKGQNFTYLKVTEQQFVQNHYNHH